MNSIEKEIKQKKFDNELVKANVNILFTANWILNKISTVLKPLNLTHEQFNVLRILRGAYPNIVCQKDILERMIAPNSNITLIINKLVTKDLIVVSQSEKDKRQYEIKINQQGLNKLKEVDEVFEKIENNFNNLSVSEAFHLNALLDKLRN